MPAFRNIRASSSWDDMYDNDINEDDLLVNEYDDEIMSEKSFYSDESDGYEPEKLCSVKKSIFSVKNPPPRLSNVFKINKLLDEQKLKEDKERELKEKEHKDVENYKKTVAPLLSWVQKKVVKDVSDSDSDSDDEMVSKPAIQKPSKYDSNFPILSENNIQNQKKLQHMYEKDKDNNLWETSTQGSRKNDKKNENEIKKTRMCNFGTECRRRNCTFAHKTSELSIRECKNGSNCMFVKKTKTNMYYNNPNKDRKCDYIHTNESRENYLKRNNIFDPISKKDEQKKENEINEDLKQFISVSEKSLPLEIKHALKTLPSNKSILFKGQYFYGKVEVIAKPIVNKPISPRQNNTFKFFKNKKNYNEKPKTPLNIPKKPVKFAQEDPEKIFIRERNQKSDEIRTMKKCIERIDNTIERIHNDKTFNDPKRLKKLLDENKKNKEKLANLETEFNNIKIIKHAPIVEKEEIQPLIEEIKIVNIPVPVIKSAPVVVLYIPPPKVVEREPEVVVPVVEREPEIVVPVVEREPEIVVSVAEKEPEIVVSVADKEPEIVVSVIQPVVISKPLSFAERIKINNKSIVHNVKPIEKPIISKPKISNVKTQLCKSFYLKTNCFHGKTCRYAHNMDELVVTNCGYENCKLVKYNKGVYVNASESKLCSYKHKGETKDNYMKRHNIK